MNIEKKIVLKVFFIQTLIVFSVFFIMKIIFKVDNYKFIEDDGYLLIAREFFKGNCSLSGKILGPVLPFLFAIIYIFPDFLLPVTRILIAQIFTLGNLFIAFLIFSKLYLHLGVNKNKYLFYGLLLFAVNPLYLYFTLKSTPEIYVTFFLLGTIYITYLFIKNYEIKYLLLCILFYGVSIFLKPALIMIPLILLIYYLFKKRIKLSLLFLVILLMNTVFFYSFIKYEEFKSDEINISYGNIDYAYITYTYLVKNIVLNGNISTGTKNTENNIEGQNHSYSKIKLFEFLDANKDKNILERNINFIKNEPFWFIIARLLTPIFFFSLYSTTKLTIFFFITNMTLLVTGIIGLKNICKNIEDKLLLNIVLLSMVGYMLLYFLTYSFVRYSVPITSIVSVFSVLFVHNYYLTKRNKI